MRLHSDEDLVKAFLRSPTWRRHTRFQPFKHRNGIRELVRSFIKSYENIPFDADTPEEVCLAANRVAHLIQSRWSTTGAQTRKDNRYAYLVYRAERAHKKYMAEKYARENPSFFGEGLPVQVKPPKRVA